MRITRIADVFILAAATSLSFSAPISAAPQQASPVTLYPSSFNFGSVVAGGPATGTSFFVENPTNAAVSVSSVAIVPAGSQSYTLQNNCSSGAPAGSSCSINVSFAPVSVGEKNCTLQVVTSAGTFSASLTGVGTPSPLSLSPTSLAFGSAVVGVSSSKSAVVTNTGQDTYTISSIKMGSNSESYTQTNNCPVQIAPGVSCTITVTYDPVSPGVKNFPLVIDFDDFTQTLPLTGTATASPISLTPSSIAFGQQPVGIPVTKPVTVTNISQSPVAFSSIGITPGKQSYSTTNNCPATLQGGANCTIQVTFAPVGQGIKNYQLLVADSVGTQRVSLSGSAPLPSIVLVPDAGLFFGTQPVGHKVSQTVFVGNGGDATVTVTGVTITPPGSQSYTLDDACPATLAPSDGCTVTVNFDPVSVGNKYYSLTVATSAATQSIPLQGTGAQASLPNLAFAEGSAYATGGTQPFSIAVADFNGDKKPDFAVANRASNTVSVFINKGDGTFDDPIITTLQVSGGGLLGRLVAADFNKDGKQDLLLCESTVNQADYVLLGKGDGTFTQLPTVPGSFGFFTAAVADFNGDGKLDYIAGDGSVLMYLGAGDGTFQAGTALPNIPNYYGEWGSVAVGDFNGDGKLDVAAVANATVGFGNGLGLLGVWFGNGDGTFQEPITQTIDSSNVFDVQAANFSGGKTPDLLFDYLQASDIGFGLGNGRFAVGLDGYGYGLPVYYSPQQIANDYIRARPADFDHDGLSDVVAADYSLGNLYVTLNAGIGIFPAPTNTSLTIPLAPPIDDIGIGDFNGDGVPDIVTCNSQTNQVSVFLSKKPQ